MSRRLVAYLGSGLAALAIAGCGAAHEIGSVVDPVAHAADVTAKVQGYKLLARTTVTTGGITVNGISTGTIDRANRTGTLNTNEAVSGKKLHLDEAFSGLTVYMSTATLPQLKSVTGGKPWIKYDESRILGGLGSSSVGGLGSTDPSQFLDYLRATGSKATPVGKASVRGVPTTEYRATVNLDGYPKLVSSAQRPAARKTVSTLEEALGTHTLTMNVWIDHAQKLVRQMSFRFNECVNDQHLALGMTLDLYDYGPQKQVTLPPADQTYDLTPLLSSAMSKVKFGCSSSA